LLVGALTLGSASPHLFNALGGLDWRVTIAVASLASLTTTIVILFVELGPRMTPSPKFNPGAILAGRRVKPLRLANFGYFGHMWELYAMWAWLGLFLQTSFLLTEDADAALPMARFATFAAIAMGAAGSIAAGLLADRLGRTTITIVAMAISG